MGRRRVDRGDDVARDLALVERTRAAGCDALQRRGERRIRTDRADRERPTVRIEEIIARTRLPHRSFGDQQPMQPRGHRETRFRERDRRLEQARPRQLAVAFVRSLEQRDNTRDTDRSPADDRVAEFHRLAVGVEESLRPCRRRRGLAPVVGKQPVVARIVNQHERAAADARRLRLDQREHELHRNRRVDRAAAGGEHAIAGVDRERIRRGHHEAPARHRGLLVSPGRALGRGIERVRAGGGERRDRCECRHDAGSDEPAVHFGRAHG